jgi:hypothetical protein
VKYSTAIILLLISFKLFSQNRDELVFNGRVIDTFSNQNFYNLMIINKRTNLGVFGNPDGSFSLKINKLDTLILSTEGYYLIKFTPGKTDLTKFSDTFYLKPKSKKLNEVIISPIKSIQSIKEERERLAKKEHKTMTGVNVLQSPITALYERFSKRAKTIEKINELKYEDEKNKILKELLSIYVLYEIIDLNQKEFDDFIIFLNINDHTLKKLDDIELVTYIKDKYSHYKSYKSQTR